MRVCALPAIACCAFALAIAMPGDAAETPREVHGSADAYAAPGVALAWGVLRGASETATVVVVRVITDPQAYPWFAATGIDPFSKGEQPLLRATQSAGPLDVRVPRAQFADYPRTELRFFASAAAAQSGTPKLVVFYLGVPDTTPELVDEAKLDVYLADRIARARAATGSKAP